MGFFYSKTCKEQAGIFKENYKRKCMEDGKNEEKDVGDGIEFNNGCRIHDGMRRIG